MCSIAMSVHGPSSNAPRENGNRMALPTSDTIVTYPDGATSSTGTVLHSEPFAGGRSAVLVDTTAFHPVDGAWPDQPADRGTLTASQGQQPIVDAVVGGILDNKVHLGADLTVRTGTDGWIFVVAHIIEGAPPAIGEQVRIEVDREYRSALGCSHRVPPRRTRARCGAFIGVEQNRPNGRAGQPSVRCARNPELTDAPEPVCRHLPNRQIATTQGLRLLRS